MYKGFQVNEHEYACDFKQLMKPLLILLKILSTPDTILFEFFISNF